MIYGSVCSGIEAASVAWHPLGWRASFLSEIEPFPRAVLAHHYPETPLHGDFTTIEAGQYAAIDVLVGGTPCQSFSVAGLRAGLRDERGNLALEFCLLARRLRPRWVVWENVPGVLSLDGGRAFASILGGLAECGYGLAFRVLDAQYVRVDGFARAVPQRRRRVFVVGCLGSWQRAVAVLFEREGLRWDSPPRRQAGEGIAQDVAPSLISSGRVVERTGETRGQDQVVAEQVAGTLNRNGKAAGSATSQDAEAGLLVAHALRAGFDASEDGRGRGTPLVPVAMGVALRGREGGATAELTGDVMTSLRTGGGGDKPHVLALNARQDPDVFDGHTGPLDTDGSTQAVMTGWRVRRLMPIECERLQGFPDGYTAIPYPKPKWAAKFPDRVKFAADGPRYKALGNSMAVNVMRWIGTRIAMVEEVKNRKTAA